MINEILPRKFEFEISEKERHHILEIIKIKIQTRYPNMDDKQGLIAYRNMLYYEIGRLDYNLAFGNMRNENKERIIQTMMLRSIFSAEISVLENEMENKNMNTNHKLTIMQNGTGILPGLQTDETGRRFFDSSISESWRNIRINGEYDILVPDTLFHGTDIEMDEDNLGEPDSEGNYFTKDGVTYFSFEENVAKRYTKVGKVIYKKLNEEDKCLYIDDTNGGIAFICQEEMYQASKEGIKYILCANPHRSDVMDISNYADFVDTRDKRIIELLDKFKIKLPEKGEMYTNYIEELGKENKRVKEKSILLIGPMGTGKSTTARLLSEKTKLPVFNLDKIRWNFFKSIGYSEEERRRIESEEGFKGVNKYWRPFELQLLQHVILEQLKEPSIIDFGAGQTVYEDRTMLEQAQKLFTNFKNVYLILPFEDKKRCKKELKKRLEHRQFKMENSRKKRISLLSKLTQRCKVKKDELEMNEEFVDSLSNETLASHIVYTNNATPQEVADEIKKHYEGVLSYDKPIKITTNKNRVVPTQTMFDKYTKSNSANTHENGKAMNQDMKRTEVRKEEKTRENQDEIS